MLSLKRRFNQPQQPHKISLNMINFIKGLKSLYPIITEYSWNCLVIIILLFDAIKEVLMGWSGGFTSFHLRRGLLGFGSSCGLLGSLGRFWGVVLYGWGLFSSRNRCRWFGCRGGQGWLLSLGFLLLNADKESRFLGCNLAGNSRERRRSPRRFYMQERVRIAALGHNSQLFDHSLVWIAARKYKSTCIEEQKFLQIRNP